MSYGPFIAAAAAVAAVFGAYKYGEAAGESRANAAEARDKEVARIASDAAITATAGAISGIETRIGSIRQEVQRGIRANPVYIDCRHPPEQLRRLNEALAGARPVAAGASGVRPSPLAIDQR